MQRFYKYQGAGNDFILIEGDRPLNPEWVSLLCHRHYGVGADGVIQIFQNPEWTFRIFNADGARASMCGNGLRCAALHTGATLMQTDAGLMEIATHEGQILTGHPLPKTLQVPNLIDTGTSHYVEEKSDLKAIDMEKEGKALREKWEANATFFQKKEGGIAIRVFEKGVEKETLACGTGAMAAAWYFSGGKGSVDVQVASGAVLTVSFEDKAWILGPAQKVFEGELPLVFEKERRAWQTVTG